MAVTELNEKLVLQNLREKWWKPPAGVDCDKHKKTEREKMQLGLSNMGGIFILLVPGVVISFLFAVMEFMLEKKNRRNLMLQGPV